MVNPFLTEGQVAASLAQQFLDEEKASLMAYTRMGTGYLADFGKSFDELKADALVEIQAKRVREAAHKRTVARLADAEREGTQAALAEHAARVKPAPANPDDAAPTHGFDLDTITRTQQEMPDDANEVRKLAKESKTLNERHHVYRDHTTPRYRAPPAPAMVESESVPEITSRNGKFLYEVSTDELMDIKAARNRIEARAAAWAMQAAEVEEEVFEAIARQREYSSQPDTPGEPELKTEAEAWQVHKPQRFGAYAAPLYRLLNNAHQAGKPRPTARDVLEAWRIATPAEVAKVLTDSIDYYDSKGNTKTATLAAIKEAITRMTRAR